MELEGSIPSELHHLRLKEAWTHRQYRIDVTVETICMFCIPLKPLVPHAVVLDVGCGIGLRVASLRRLGVQAFGLDLDTRVLKLGIDEASDYLIGGDMLDITCIRQLPFMPEVIISDDVFEHIEQPDIIRFLRIAHELGISGMVHSLTPLEHVNDIHADPTHVTKLSAADWRDFLGSTPYWNVVGDNTIGKRHGVFHLVRT